ncbi:hypothetical protein V6N11_054988 [Hibiscus sabdariffa]|uniref:Uncharacterized protein n=1 Tax=Hibiscus sabdariffa TaxID=183260 RepID=A0ABR2P3I2_9ROSI
MSSSRSRGTYGEVDLPSECDTENLVGRWGESLDDFSEDDENIVPITEDDDFELLDANDVSILRTAAVEGNDLDVEDDVWAAAVARLGLVEDPIVWGFVQTEPNVEDVWANVVARMKLVDEPIAWGYVQPGPNQSAHILEDTMTAYEPPAHMHERVSNGIKTRGALIDHGGHSSEPFQSMPYPPEYFEDWSSWEEDPTHVRVSSGSTNPWEQPINRHQIVCGTSSQHTEAGVSRLSNVGSSSYNPANEEVYHPQFEHPQSFSVHGESVTIDNMTSWLSTTTIFSPLCVENILSTPPTMQIMDDQLNEDELTPENPQLP